MVVKTVLNDRKGHVKEHFWDKQNHMVRSREYTGRGDPDQPTTEITNRPVNKLRDSDPEFFETLYQWNQDSLQKRVIYPNGNIIEYVYASDLDPNAPPRLRRNLLTFRRLPGTHAPAGNQAVIEASFEYHPIP